MNRKPLKIAALLFATGAGSLCFAQMDVDQADSLNFEAFHKDKKESVKVWKDDKNKAAEPVKAYDQQQPTPAAAGSGSTLTSAPVTSAAPVPAAPAQAASAPAAPAKADYKPGQRFELRERYSLTRSAKTPYSAFYVIEALHQQAARLCPKGWKKLSERSEPVEQDFFQYFEIECL